MTFSRNINYGEWALKVSFMRIHAPIDKFFVVFETDQGEVANFEMIRHLDHWVVIHPAPDWILPMQNQLSMYISNAMN